MVNDRTAVAALNPDDLRAAIDALRRIHALAMNPHWTTDRRWTIAELSASALQFLNASKGGAR